jgi:hypothetical protein
VQSALSPLPDWEGDVPADPSRQAWLEKISYSLGTAWPLGQSQKRKSVISEALLPLTLLTEEKASGFRRIIIGDELWFFFYCPLDSVWAASRDERSHASSRKLTQESSGFDPLVGEQNPQYS